MTKLEEMREGDWVRWDSRDWEVTDRDLCRESADYSETQWELTPDSGPAHYLVASGEKKAGGLEEIWVCTRQTSISDVQYLAPEGDWRSFRAQDTLTAAPAQARYDGLELRLDGETEGLAEDDEGDTVTKLTWDYYDPTRRRNIAIEIWKEPDADYYEAYDGRVVSPSDFAPIPPPAGGRRNYGGKDGPAKHVAAAAFSAIFLLPMIGLAFNAAGAGAEYLLALLLPAACVYLSFLRGSHGGLLFVSLAASLAAALLLMKLRGLGGSYWEYAVYGVLAGAAIAETASKLFVGVLASDKAAAAGNAALLMLFVLSFAHYVKFAPRPHNIEGLLAACVLPLLPALLVFFVYVFKGGSDEQPQA